MMLRILSLLLPPLLTHTHTGAPSPGRQAVELRAGGGGSRQRGDRRGPLTLAAINGKESGTLRSALLPAYTFLPPLPQGPHPLPRGAPQDSGPSQDRVLNGSDIPGLMPRTQAHRPDRLSL